MINQHLSELLLWCGLISLTIWAGVFYIFVGLLKIPVYHPFSVYMLYHLLGFIVRPLSVALTHDSFIWYRIGYVPWPEDVVQTTIVLNMALVSCAAGVFTVAMRRGTFPLLPPTKLLIARPIPFSICAVFLTLLGLYSTYRGYGGGGLDQVNGFNTKVDAAGGQQLQDVSGYTLALAEALPVLCIILLISKAPRLFAFSATGLFVSLRLYVGAQRLSFVVVIAVAIFDYLIRTRRRFPSFAIIISLVLGYVAFDMVGHDRFVLRRVIYGEANITSLWESYVSDRGGGGRSNAMDVVEFETATAAMAIVDHHSGHSWGTQYLRILIWPIPRQIWPSKPVFTSTVDLNAYGYNFLYLTYSLYADLYMAFAYPGVILGMLLLGWGMGRVYDMAGRTDNAVAYMFFWVFLIYLKTVLRDGGTTFVYFWGFSMVFSFLLIRSGGVTLVRDKNRDWAHRIRNVKRRSSLSRY